MLTTIQQNIVEYSENLIVQASAGTGKTHTLVSKINYESLKYKGFKTFAAITFTISAAAEIKKRMQTIDCNAFIGTNNSFVVEEIIKPFLKDVYLFNIVISADYSIKFTTFEEGLKFLQENGLLGTYYDNQENFIFELAMNIIKNSTACQRFLVSKYYRIYIDEYQDCDLEMHSFFMFLANKLNIKMFIVGDSKQSIYIWRGANPQSFNSIKSMEGWNYMEMHDNFRSTVQIQNYFNLLFDETTNLYSDTFEKKSLFLLCCKKEDCSKKILEIINKNDKIAILRLKRNDAKQCSKLFTTEQIKVTYIPITPIDDISNNSTWLYMAIAKSIILSNYSAYDFLYDIPDVIEDDRVIIKIKHHLKKIKRIYTKKDDFISEMLLISKLLNYTVKDDELSKLFETVNQNEYYPAFSKDIKNISTTLHSSKGLEFDQVIIFAEDYNLNSNIDIYNHYVASTRAKSRLIIICLIDGNQKNKKFLCNISKKIFDRKINITDLFDIKIDSI